MNPNKKRLRRTMMFLNAQKPGLIKDPYIYKPDSIMLDLEDAVAENQKDAARFSLYHALKTINYRGCERVVRINGLDTPYWREDIRCAVAGGCDSIRIPKTESAKDVKVVEEEIIKAEKDFGREEGSVLIMSAIESARGVMHALDVRYRTFRWRLYQRPSDTYHRNRNRAHGSKTEYGNRSKSRRRTVL